MDIIVDGITKTYGRQNAVDKLSFQVKTGEVPKSPVIIPNRKILLWKQIKILIPGSTVKRRQKKFLYR